MSNLQRQVGGDHYSKMKVQPTELITELKCSFYQGNIIKYLSRYKSKNGKQDLEKVIHYAQIAIERQDRRVCVEDAIFHGIPRFCKENGLSKIEEDIMREACYDNYDIVIRLGNKLIEQEYGTQI